MRDRAVEVREAAGNVRWIVAWSAVAAIFLIGLLGAFTIGAIVLPVATSAAMVVVVLQVRAARTAEPSPGRSSPRYVGEDRVARSIDSTSAPLPSSNPLTSVALTLSCASILVAPLSFAGLITGAIALREIRGSGGAQAGSGRAVAAVVISALVAFAYVTLMVAVFHPR